MRILHLPHLYKTNAVSRRDLPPLSRNCPVLCWESLTQMHIDIESTLGLPKLLMWRAPSHHHSIESPQPPTITSIEVLICVSLANCSPTLILLPGLAV